MLLEQRDDGRVAHSSCDGQRRVPSAVRLVRVGAGLQQRMARWLTKMDQRVVEGREAAVALLRRRGTVRQKLLDDADVAGACGVD